MILERLQKVLFLALISYFLALEEVEDYENAVAVGIDLGTTYSCVAYFNKFSGQVEILEDLDHMAITPSQVVLENDGSFLVGWQAKNYSGDSPNLFYDSKRLIGRKFKEKVVQNDMKSWPFSIVEGEDGKPVFKPVMGENNMSKKAIEKVTKTGTFPPETISSVILRHLLKGAQEKLKKKVTHAVITVPAYFGTQQRTATIDAGKLSDIKVLRVINEPTAAAIAFGLEQKSGVERKVLVFDLGGGTFDVSVLEIDAGFYDVLASDGDSHLGGQDFDKMIRLHFEEVSGVKFSSLSSTEQISLKNKCEAAKKELSKVEEAEITVKVKGSEVSVKMTRADFEKKLSKLKKRINKKMDSAMSKANIKYSQLTDVVLIGGSTRIPFIQKLVKEKTGKNPITGIDPDKAVAYGAAIEAAILTKQKNDKIDDLVINDVTPLALGIETEGGVMAHIVQMNEKVPIKKSQTFQPASAQQDSVVIKVYQGPSKMAKRNVLLGQFSLTGIGKNFPQIEVTFDIDANQVVRVYAHEKGNQQKGEITLDNAGTMSEEEKENILNVFKENEEADRIESETVTIKQRVVNQASALLGQEQSEDVKSKVQEILNEVNLVTEFNQEGLEKAKAAEAKLQTILQMAGAAQAGAGPKGDEEEEGEDEDDEGDEL